MSKKTYSLNSDGASIEFSIMETFNAFFCQLRSFHRYESITSWLSCFFISHYFAIYNASKFTKFRLKIFLSNARWQSSHIKNAVSYVTPLWISAWWGRTFTLWWRRRWRQTLFISEQKNFQKKCTKKIQSKTIFILHTETIFVEDFLLFFLENQHYKRSQFRIVRNFKEIWDKI